MGAPANEVELRHVSKSFQSHPAVLDVSLSIGAGEFVTLLGPSGCGKTTILRMIAGFEAPDSGSVFLRGRDVNGLPPHRRDVCTVFQQYALFPHLTVFENVAFGLRRRKSGEAETAKRVRSALELVQLVGTEARRPAGLSGGEQQRVALARALVLEPKVLLLDEPLAALDLKLRRQMQSELKRLQRQIGIAFVFVTHDQEEALTMSDRVAILRAGRLLQIGTPEDLYDRPETRFVADFLGEANILPARILSRDDTAVRIGVAGSVLNLPHFPGAPSSGEFLLAVRPERIALRCEPGENLVPCRLQERTFHGEAVTYRVQTGDGTVVQVRNAEGENADVRIRSTDRLFIDLDSASPVVVRDDRN
ncbi:MAG: ABC transporter ATP-binding protein [Acidobacteria bacterium]|nr:ABC transporter ATP-binding protein [Acidobacteriota bacterium]